MLLSDLLKTPVLIAADVIAGHEGLTIHDVQSINIMDAPDIVTFLKKGDLLLTNGYLLKDRPDALIDFITSMHRKGCAGLAIKTKRFSMSIPQEVLDEANRLHFPIIELSLIESTLGEIFQQSISIILENKNEELHYALTIHKQFADMIMQGDGLGRIVDALADILASPVLLLNVKLQPLARSSGLYEPALQELPELAAAAIASFPASESALSVCFPHIRAEGFRHAELFPIHTYRHEGYLLSFHNDHTISGLSALAFEQAAHVIGLELTKKHAVKERSRRYKNEFFSDLIEGHLGTEQEVLHRGGKYGLTADGKAFLIVAKLDEQPEWSITSASRSSEERLSVERDAQYEAIKRELAKLGIPFVMFTKNDLFGIVVQHSVPDWNETAFARGLEAAAERMWDADQLSFSFGIGNPFTNVLDLGLSYKEAIKALSSGRQMNRKRFAQSYHAMDIGRLLRLLPYDELERFYVEAFKDLIRKDDKEKNEMLRTLKIFYENQCQINDTAKALFVHRNTVIYRIEKAERLIGRSLKDWQVSFRFQVAFAIEPLLKNEKYS